MKDLIKAMKSPMKVHTHLKIMKLEHEIGNYSYITLRCSTLGYKTMAFTLKGEDRVHLFRDRFSIGDSVNIVADTNNVIQRISKALDVIG